VMLTHASVGVNLVQIDALHTMGPDDRIVAVLPFFHIYGMTVLMNVALRKGATVVVLPRFDLAQFIDVLEQHRITRAYVAPPVVLAMAKHPAFEGRDFSALTFILSAAAPLDAELAAVAARRLDCELGQAYGMTELSPGTHLVPDGTAAEAPPGTIGKLFPSTEARLVSVETGEDVGIGEPGEIWIRGPQRMKGYFGRQEETDTLIDADGWLHTGDIGTVDKNGWWHVVDRVKELIKYKGYQVAPAELEAVLLASPDVADAAVIGVYDERGDEVPKAFVVRAPGSTATEDDVLAFVAERTAPYKRVRQLEFIEAVPKSASGKILRRELRVREKEQTA
jgi:acyl-CoA synthetase (AMP-forming)/AMP-acid ligase II